MIATTAFYVSIGTLLLRKCCFENNFAFFSFSDRGWSFSVPLAKSSNLIVETAFDVSIATLWWKLLFWTKTVGNFIMLGHWTNLFRVHGETLLASVQILSAGLPNRLLFVLKSRFSWGNVFFSRKETFIFYYFQTLIRKSSGLCQKFPDGFVKTAGYLSRGTLRG